MGRKIPGRKHKGVKDPEKQAALRLAKLKDKINAPPTNADEQHIPKSLVRLIELKDKVKSGLFNKKKKNKNIQQTDAKPEHKANRNHTKKGKINKVAPSKPTPKFIQNPGESNNAFLYRVNQVCKSVIREAAFEDKFGVDIKRDASGQIEKVEKRPKDELQVLINKAKKDEKNKSKKKKKKKDEGPKLTKSQKWALKKKEKLKKKLEDSGEKEFNQKDTVKFGEIVHAPPTLTAPKKAEKLNCAPRPGNKQLLLNSMLPNKSEKSSSNDTLAIKTKGEAKLKKVQHKAIDKKGKRKDLPNAMRRQLDKQQKEIIEAYKKLKSKKYGS